MSAYTEMNKMELRAACKEAGIKGYGNMNNDAMRAALGAATPEVAAPVEPVGNALTAPVEPQLLLTHTPEAVEPAAPTEVGATFSVLFGLNVQPVAARPVVPAGKAAKPETSRARGGKIQKDRPEQNGITRPSKGSMGDQLWSMYDKLGSETTLAQAKALAAKAGLNLTSSGIALYNWRKFNSIGSKKA